MAFSHLFSYCFEDHFRGSQNSIEIHFPIERFFVIFGITKPSSFSSSRPVQNRSICPIFHFALRISALLLPRDLEISNTIPNARRRNFGRGRLRLRTSRGVLDWCVGCGSGWVKWIVHSGHHRTHTHTHTHTH